MKEWFKQWFNEDYVNLYDSRDEKEASKHVSSIIKLLNLRGKERILDLGCGMGRHSIPFGERGFEVIGVDISSYLIQKAKEHPHPNVTFIEGDMFHLNGLDKFDCILNLFTSFGYFDSDKKNSSIFGVVKAHLNEGGKFFLDYLHPDQVKRDLITYEEREVSGEKVSIEKKIEGDRVIKTITFPNRTYVEKVKLYSRSQIETMLHAHGLKPIAVYNDYQGNPWQEKGERQLFVCI